MEKKYYHLFLDDDPRRIPHQLTWIELPLVEWTIVRNYDDFVAIILKQGVPATVSFDHDLGNTAYQEYFRANGSDKTINYENITERTGYDCAKWLAQYCVDNNIPVPLYYIHTLNHMGFMNIHSVLESARKVMTDVAKTEIPS